jgi:myosin heavy subunit
LQHVDSFIHKSDFLDRTQLDIYVSNFCFLLNLINTETPLELKAENLRSCRALLKATRTTTFSFAKNEKTEETFEFESPIVKFKDSVIKIAHSIYCVLLKGVYDASWPILQTAFDKSVTPLITLLQRYYKLVKESRIFVMNQFFAQVMYFYNAFFFDQMSNGKFCGMTYAITLKMNINQLEHFCIEFNLSDDAITQLKPVRQACDICIMNKVSLVDESLRKEICPDLNNNQVRKILTNYKPDQFDEQVPEHIIRGIPATNEKFELDPFLVFSIAFPSIDLGKWNQIKCKELNFDFLK